MTFYTIAPEIPFLDTIARAWLDTREHPECGMILLPTRRACRELARRFLAATGGKPTLLPRIVAIGTPDETPLALASAIDLPEAIPAMQRLALLSRLLLAGKGHAGLPKSLDRIWVLARELAHLMDEADREGVDLATVLPKAVDAAFAEHWQKTLDFLQIVTLQWPSILAERGQINPVARQVRLLEAQAALWRAAPPAEPVWAAGIASFLPAIATLLGALRTAPGCRVILPGFDLSLGGEAAAALPPSHPQHGMVRLIAAAGARIGDIEPFPGTKPAGARSLALNQSFLPKFDLAGWRDATIAAGAEWFRLTASGNQEDAMAIAMVIRDALQDPAKQAALVTPDRALAASVSAQLGRFGIVADDSAGEALGETPPGAFFRLIARAIAENLAPVPLLALLKHPLTCLGLPQAQCRAAVRAMEIAIFRGRRRPLPGLANLRIAFAPHPELQDFLSRLETALEPAIRIHSAAAAAPGERLRALVQTAEALAAADTQTGPARLWAGEEGNALAALLAEARDALALLESYDLRPQELPGLIDALLTGAMVRGNRALRGREGEAEHPRVAIWGLLEARLQSADVLILGGLVEGKFPPEAEPGPFLSRPMRTAISLPSPEQRTGQAALDFVLTACAAPRVVFACPARDDGAPAVPSRFLVRLETMLAAQRRPLIPHPASAWAQKLDIPIQVEPEPPPAPRPPLAARPKQLSITEIETWRRDPYAIYARHILRLKPLDPLDMEAADAIFGNIVHDALSKFYADHGKEWPQDAEHRLQAAFALALFREALPANAARWWQPRLDRLAGWIVATETVRRADYPVEAVKTEVDGSLNLSGGFTLTGRADRIDRFASGAVAIIDYKTGTVPAKHEIESGVAPQLPLEAAMALQGGFGGIKTREIAELAYWKLSGGGGNGKVVPLGKNGGEILHAMATASLEKLSDLVKAYANPAQPYLAVPDPKYRPRFSPYANLERLAEWAGGDGDMDEEGGEA